jgi:hypothetical protein
MKTLYAVIIIASTYALCANGLILKTNILCKQNTPHKTVYCKTNNQALQRPAYAVPKTNEYQILENRIKRLESVLRDLCGAIMYCDDIAVMERKTAQHGVIYKGVRCSEHRNPVFMRRAVHNILLDHQMIATPLKYTWHTNYTNKTQMTNLQH